MRLQGCLGRGAFLGLVVAVERHALGEPRLLPPHDHQARDGRQRQDQVHGLRGIPVADRAIADLLADALGAPLLEHVAAEQADDHLRAEPGDGRQREIGTLLTLGGHGRDVVLEPGGPQHLTHRQQDHEQDRRGVVTGLDVRREPGSRNGQDQHARHGDERTDDQHVEHLVDLGHPLEQRDQHDQADHDEDGVDGEEHAHIHVFLDAVADDADPVLGHDGVDVEEHRTNAQQEDDEQEGLPERGGLQHQADVLPGTLALLELLRLFHGLVRADESQGGEDTEGRGNDTHEDHVGGGQAHLLHQQADHQAGEDGTQVHEQVPQVERRALRRLGRETLVGRLERSAHHGHGEAHEHEQEHHQKHATGEHHLAEGEDILARELLVPRHPAHTEGGQATEQQRHVERLPGAQPVRDGATDENGHADGTTDDGVHVARPLVAETELVGQEDGDDGEEGEVGQSVEDVDHLNAPEPEGTVLQDREVLQVLNDGVAPRRAFLFRHVGSSRKPFTGCVVSLRGSPLRNEHAQRAVIGPWKFPPSRSSKRPTMRRAQN